MYGRFELGPLDVNQICYWRIDEANEVHPDSPRKGAVWRFTTADCLNIDDFEGYLETEGQGERWFGYPISWNWLDSYWVECHFDPIFICPSPAFLDYSIVHSGRRSMAFLYDNTQAYRGYWTEIHREYSSLYDWTAHGGDTLVLYIRGRASNAPEALFLGVEDNRGKSAWAVHPDPQILRTAEWREWKIPLSGLVDVRMDRIEELHIGVGDRSNPKPGGAGVVYIDDIRVIKSTP